MTHLEEWACCSSLIAAGPKTVIPRPQAVGISRYGVQHHTTPQEIATPLRARDDGVGERVVLIRLGGGRNLVGRVMTLPYKIEGKISKNQLTIQKFMLKYTTYCNAIRKRSSLRHHERRRDSESLRWDQLRATFVRPERSGRVLPIQSD